MIVSFANTLRFFKSDSGIQNYRNSSAGAKMFNLTSYPYSQRFFAGATIPIQVYAGTEAEPTVTFEGDDGTTTTLTPFATDTGTYYSYNLTFSKPGYVKIVGVNDTYFSEHLEITTSEKVLIQWWNADDAFAFHSRPDIMNYMWLDGAFMHGNVKGKSTVFDNQGEEVKIKEYLFSTIELVTEPLPLPICEKIAIACAHDIFVVNNIEFVVDSIPTMKQMGNSTMYEMTIKMTDRTALGINRHDTGSASAIVPSSSYLTSNYYIGVPTGTIYT